MGNNKDGQLTLAQGLFVVVAGVSISAALILVPAAHEPTTTAGYSHTSLTAYADKVERKYAGNVNPDDAITIAIGACSAFDANPATAYRTFTAKSASYGIPTDRTDFMVRAAVQMVCPHHKSDLP